MKRGQHAQARQEQCQATELKLFSERRAQWSTRRNQESFDYLGQLVHKAQRVTVVDRPSVHRLRVCAMLWPDQPPIVVVASIERRHLLLFRTLWVFVMVRVQPGVEGA